MLLPLLFLFLSDLSNPHDFSLFANSGWDGNWYVGYNACWIQKISVPPKEKARKAYVGAKLGRMKWMEPLGRQPWEKQPLPGEVYISIASTPSWTKNNSHLLVESQDIPLESDSLTAVEGTGESRWFWKEIPLEQIHFGADNFLAVWSPTRSWVKASSAPILAAGWGSRETNSWLNTEVRGEPPSNPKGALLTPVTVFEPAIAVKLIYETDLSSPVVKIDRIESDRSQAKGWEKQAVWCSVQGESIERVWIEISNDGANWKRLGRFLWNAPYVFNLKARELPLSTSGKVWVRAKAADVSENIGISEAVNIFEKKEKMK